MALVKIKMSPVACGQRVCQSLVFCQGHTGDPSEDEHGTIHEGTPPLQE